MPVDRELFDFLVANVRSSNKELTSRTLESPVKIFLALLKDNDALESFEGNETLKIEMSETVTDIWRPSPRGDRDKETKRKVRDYFPSLISQICKVSKKYKTQSKSISVFFKQEGSEPSYEASKPSIEEKLDVLFDELDSKFEQSRARMEEKWEKAANPFLTSVVANSWDEGILFQIGAKTAASVETIWGTWIEKAVYAFNPDLYYIGAGGIDFVKGTTAYDAKSGPQVMNKDQVEEAKTKNRIMQTITANKILEPIIGIYDFKVAICYGSRSKAWPFMAKAGNLIIYGPETWDELTGDAWNSLKLFLHGLSHKIGRGGKWEERDVDLAISSYIQSFYDGDQKMLINAKNHSYFKYFNAKHFK